MTPPNYFLDCRKRRARERQQKLMAQFASKQKEFMEKIVNDPVGKKHFRLQLGKPFLIFHVMRDGPSKITTNTITR